MSDVSDTPSAPIMLCRIVIRSYSEFPESGEICIIEFELELSMIDLMLLLMVVLLYSALLACRWASTYPQKPNGRLRTGREKNYVLLPLTINLCHRLLYCPQLVVDGNMKLVHQIQKRSDDDVSLCDGELFMVKRAPYAEDLAHAPQIQPVSLSKIRVKL